MSKKNNSYYSIIEGQIQDELGALREIAQDAAERGDPLAQTYAIEAICDVKVRIAEAAIRIATSSVATMQQTKIDALSRAAREKDRVIIQKPDEGKRG